MRIRCIKPEFWVSESVGRLSREARLLFIGLWSFADDSGRGRGALPAISGSLLPYDSDASEKLSGWMSELEREGMIRRYFGHDGNSYYDIPNWLKHQKIEKPSKSKFPEFTEYSPNTPRILPEQSPLDQGSGNRDQGTGIMEQGASSATPKKQRNGNGKSTDGEFLASLKTDPTYAGLDIDLELGKCRRWCEVNGKQPSRRRLVNWLNRSRPLTGGQSPASGAARGPSVRNTLICGSDEWDRQAAEAIARTQPGMEGEGFGFGGIASESSSDGVER